MISRLPLSSLLFAYVTRLSIIVATWQEGGRGSRKGAETMALCHVCTRNRSLSSAFPSSSRGLNPLRVTDDDRNNSYPIFLPSGRPAERPTHVSTCACKTYAMSREREDRGADGGVICMRQRVKRRMAHLSTPNGLCAVTLKTLGNYRPRTRRYY